MMVMVVTGRECSAQGLLFWLLKGVSKSVQVLFNGI